MSKTYNFDIFQTVSQIWTSPPPKFWGGSEIWSHPPMRKLLKLHYEKFGVSNLFFQKLSKKSLGTGRVKELGLSLLIFGLTQLLWQIYSDFGYFLSLFECKIYSPVTLSLEVMVYYKVVWFQFCAAYSIIIYLWQVSWVCVHIFCLQDEDVLGWDKLIKIWVGTVISYPPWD